MLKIADLKVGDRDTLIILKIKEVDLKFGQSGEYADIKAVDGVQQVNLKYWNINDEVKSKLIISKIYNFKVNVKEYKGSRQLEVKELEKVNLSEEEIKSLEILPPIDLDKIRTSLLEYINQIENKDLFQITKTLFEENQEEFFNHQAAISMHHAYKGGLAYHTLCMLDIANIYIKVYEFLSKDLIYSGIILHDLGKIHELTTGDNVEYTMKGSLVGHISIVYKMIVKVVEKLKIDDNILITKLEHVILAHHGKLEYGSPILPQTPEALVVYFIDNCDAKMGALIKAKDSAGDSKKTERINALDNKSFYV